MPSIAPYHLQVQAHLEQVASDVAYIKAKIEEIPDHEDRLRSLERFRYSIPGVGFATAAVAMVTAALAITGVGGH